MEDEIHMSMGETKLPLPSRINTCTVLFFDVENRRLFLSSREATMEEFGLPVVADNAPAGIVESGTIDEESEQTGIY